MTTFWDFIITSKKQQTHHQQELYIDIDDKMTRNIPQNINVEQHIVIIDILSNEE